MSALCSVPAVGPEKRLVCEDRAGEAAGTEQRACPVCGHVAELERMTPELLWFRCGAGARRGAVMPDGRWAVLAGDLVVTLTDDEWRHYKAMVKHAAEFVLAKYGEEVAA